MQSESDPLPNKASKPFANTDRHTDRYTDRHTDSNIDVAGPSLPTRPRVGTPLPVRIPTRLDTHMDSDEDGDQSDSDDGDKTRLRRR
jgi:hypothetical protein